ncbi:hypothetical protein VCRA2119O147_730004 [Vibrio crassostreae]|nr:hypothetical protein VCRA2114E123_280025 [Vibrio crassostreae]CAK1942230.1 hypothetical protein VCRA2110O113_280026 [Vibrio crassostreae]CAK1944015.1 hypothetical protein VCRA2114E122_280025 [Vibrio crassostreae]CAK2003085.1 hypothetical protein VCRA2110O135_310025 [Vibrio crassostreae]CAK2010060.1 hypothetical protein VCRA2113O120_320025 [Vibrio crassostreae]
MNLLEITLPHKADYKTHLSLSDDKSQKQEQPIKNPSVYYFLLNNHN